MNRLQRALGVFASGCVVYFVMAACTTVHVHEGSYVEEPDPVAKPKPVADDAMVSASSAGGLTASSSGDPFPTSTSSTSGSPVPSAMADEWHKPGKRLRLMYIQAEDGSQQFKSWFDTERQDACTFKVYSDSSLRCVPETFPANVVQPALKVWASSDCTGGRAIVVGSGLPPPKHFAEGVNIYLVGLLAYNGPTSTGSPGACTPGSAVGQPFEMTFIPPSAFVGGQVKLAPVQ